MIAILLLANALIAVAMIILILLQRNDPAAGGIFGGGSGSQPVIRNPLARPTAFLAALFLLNCIVIAVFTRGHEAQNTVMAAPEAAGAGAVSPTMPELPAAVPMSAPLSATAVPDAADVSPAAK
jgi:protein translocase SecG subunit